MSKIDIDKFVCSLLEYANDNCEGILVDYLCSSLQDQGLQYKDGEIVPTEMELKEITEEEFKEIHTGRCLVDPDTIKGTDQDGGVKGEKGEKGGFEKYGKVWHSELEYLLSRFAIIAAEGDITVNDSSFIKMANMMRESVKKEIINGINISKMAAPYVEYYGESGVLYRQGIIDTIDKIKEL